MTGYGLKQIPPDIFKFLIQQQTRLKLERGTNSFSFETTLYNILREHPRYIEFKEKIEQNKL